MTTKTETIRHHICDLCGQERDGEEILTLNQRKEQESGGRVAYVIQSKTCDVCLSCLGEPIYKVQAFLNGDKLYDPLVDPPPAIRK
jgi:hypothetical protein